MVGETYWYLGKGPIDVPYWTSVLSHEAEVEGEPPLVPMLFTTWEKAEAELLAFNEQEADEYLRNVQRWGEETMNRALDNTPLTKIFEIDRWLLREHLLDSELVYVMIDYELKSAQRLAEELR